MVKHILTTMEVQKTFRVFIWNDCCKCRINYQKYKLQTTWVFIFTIIALHMKDQAFKFQTLDENKHIPSIHNCNYLYIILFFVDSCIRSLTFALLQIFYNSKDNGMFHLKK